MYRYQAIKFQQLKQYETPIEKLQFQMKIQQHEIPKGMNNDTF